MNAHYLLNQARLSYPTSVFGSAPESQVIGTINDGLDDPREVTEAWAISALFNQEIEEFNPKEDDDSEEVNAHWNTMQQCKELLIKHWSPTPVKDLRCHHCEGGTLTFVEANPPYSGDHYQCEHCDSTYPDFVVEGVDVEVSPESLKKLRGE